MKHFAWIMVFSLVSLFGGGCAGKNTSSGTSKVEEAAQHYRMGQDLLLKGETTQALGELLRAEALSDEPEIQNLLGLTFLQLDEPAKGEERFRNAIKLDETYSEAQNHLCALLIPQGKYDEAIRHCTKAVQNLQYETPERAYHNMGLAFLRKGDREKAMKSFQKGLLHNGKFVMSRNELGNIFMEDKQFKQAADVLKVAAETCDDSPEGVWREECTQAYYNLARVYLRLQKKPQAMTAFQSCVKADRGEGSYGEKCRGHLEKLQH